MRDVDELIASGRRDFLTFWGHRPRKDGSVGPGCLSQWWPAAFTLDRVVFATAEHRMMWGKARLFDDDATAARGRFDIVLAANQAKFRQNPRLGRYLVGTGDAVLVEAAPNDAVWGIGIAADDPRVQDPSKWPGLNLLGFALMAVRDELRTEWPDGASAGA